MRPDRDLGRAGRSAAGSHKPASGNDPDGTDTGAGCAGIKKGGGRCIDEGLAAVLSKQEQVREEARAVAAVAGTLARETGTLRQRKGRYQRLLRQYQGQGGEFYEHLAKTSP